MLLFYLFAGRIFPDRGVCIGNPGKQGIQIQ